MKLKLNNEIHKFINSLYIYLTFRWIWRTQRKVFLCSLLPFEPSVELRESYNYNLVKQREEIENEGKKWKKQEKEKEKKKRKRRKKQKKEE